MYSFKDYLVVDYTQTGDEQLALNAKKRKGGDTTGPIAEDDVDEALTIAQRQKAKQTFRKNKAKIEIGRKKAAKKLASMDKLKKRAEKKARDILVKKMTKDVSKDELSYGARVGIEKRLEKKKGAIQKIAKKLLPKIKQADREKLKKPAGKQ